MISVSKALSTMSEAIAPLAPERVPIGAAAGFTTASPIRAQTSLPPFRQSAMDGFALRSSDVSRAGADAPVPLDVVGEATVGAGRTGPSVGPGEAVKISTGAPLPEGADSVVRREEVDVDGTTVVVGRSVENGCDVRPVGEEVESGELLVPAGTRLDERRLAAASMAGVARVNARDRPKLALLVSGDEVVDPGAERRPGEVFDANTPLLANWIRRATGGSPDVARISDDFEQTRSALRSAVASSDLIVSTGGVSMGDDDHLVDAADDLGARKGFWRVAQRPAKPVYFAVVEGTPYLGLPGNPGAALVSAVVYLRRAVDVLQGLGEPGPGRRVGRLTAPIERKTNRTQWVGVRVRGRGPSLLLEPVPGHRLGQLHDIDGLVELAPGDDPLGAGGRVDWIDLRATGP